MRLHSVNDILEMVIDLRAPLFVLAADAMAVIERLKRKNKELAQLQLYNGSDIHRLEVEIKRLREQLKSSIRNDWHKIADERSAEIGRLKAENAHLRNICRRAAVAAEELHAAGKEEE